MSIFTITNIKPVAYSPDPMQPPYLKKKIREKGKMRKQYKKRKKKRKNYTWTLTGS